MNRILWLTVVIISILAVLLLIGLFALYRSSLSESDAGYIPLTVFILGSGIFLALVYKWRSVPEANPELKTALSELAEARQTLEAFPKQAYGRLKTQATQAHQTLDTYENDASQRVSSVRLAIEKCKQISFGFLKRLKDIREKSEASINACRTLARLSSRKPKALPPYFHQKSDLSAFFTQSVDVMVLERKASKHESDLRKLRSRTPKLHEEIQVKEKLAFKRLQLLFRASLQNHRISPDTHIFSPAE